MPVPSVGVTVEITRRAPTRRAIRNTPLGLMSGPRRRAHRQQSGEGGDPGAVGANSSAGVAGAAEHGGLVAQNQDLDLLGMWSCSPSTIQAQELENIW